MSERRNAIAWPLLALSCLAGAAGPASAAAPAADGATPAGAARTPIASIPREQLVAANYRQGMLAFQQRCSACHALAEGSADLAGPALHGMFKRRAGSKPGFGYSSALASADFHWDPGRVAAYIADPARVVPGTSMALPEPVPEADRVALISYLMLETGAADWPRPAPPRVAAKPPGPARDAAASGVRSDLAQRYPSFWNHLMKNTTRYRLVNAEGEFRFDAYFNMDGSVSSNDTRLKGFWHVDAEDMFCYALYGLPVAPRQLVECFPVVAMSIPRFREELWTTQIGEGIRLSGGIVAGRP